MNSRTAVEVFRLFNMSEKTENQIMSIIKSTQYEPSACEAGVPLLFLEKNILEVMEKSFYAGGVCKVALKRLKMQEWSENKILSFIDQLETSTARDTLKKISIPYFKLKQKKEYQILNLLKKVKHDYYFRKACIEALNLKSKTDEQLWSIIELSDYQAYICIGAIRCFTKDEYILSLIQRHITTDLVLSEAAKCIRWEGNSEDQIMYLIGRGKYNFHFCEKGIVFLKKVSNILFVMAEGHHCISICKLGIPMLNLAQKTPGELFSIMAPTYDYLVCDACLKFFELPKQSEEALVGIMQRTGYNEFVCMRCLPWLKNETLILSVIRETSFQVGVCRTGLPMLSNETDIAYIIASSGYNTDICEIGITLLTNEQDIFEVMEKTNFYCKVCKAGVKTLANIKVRAKKKVKK